MYISTPYACLEPAEAQRGHIGSPELEIEQVVSFHVVASYQTPVF